MQSQIVVAICCMAGLAVSALSALNRTSQGQARQLTAAVLIEPDRRHGAEAVHKVLLKPITVSKSYSSGAPQKVLKRFDHQHAAMRTNNTLPQFELRLPADVGPGSNTMLVKFNVKALWREITILPWDNSFLGFTKDEVVFSGIEPAVADTLRTPEGAPYRVYKVYPIKAMAAGEYALFANGLYYDFGIDAR
jgi:hypothetical protein